MPIGRDTSPNIKWPLPEGLPAFSKSNIFPENMLKEIQQTISQHAIWGPENETNSQKLKYHTVSGRWVTDVPFSKEVWDHIEFVGRTSWDSPKLRLKQMWVARYQQYKGSTPYLWEHVDQLASQYTIDICIESKGIESWGLYVDGEKFEEAENSGVFFMAQQQIHSRPPYPVDDPEAYQILLFCLFASPEHWIYDIDAYDPDQDEHLRKLLSYYESDGNIRYYELTGHLASFDDAPKTNPVCPDGCTQCLPIPKDYIEKLDWYKPLE